MKARLGLLLLAGVADACAHRAPPVPARLDWPNWPIYRRRAAGARVTYPDAAWAQAIEGEVAVELCIDARGETTRLRPISGPPALTSAVLRAAATWQFEPQARPGCLERRYRFRRNPAPEDFFRTEADSVITRDYQPPLPMQTPAPAAPSRPVYVRVCPDAQGAPVDVTILEGASPVEDAQVARTVQGWRYQPAHLRGQPIPACTMVRVPPPG
jgi:TonB family protein